MYGAILGDIIGSPFEFGREKKAKDFDLFSPGCTFTDDTVLTIAVAEALMKAGSDAPREKIESEVVKHMRRWGRKYPNAGYGGRFRQWLMEKNPSPYKSFGNGSAMRVSAAGWLYPTMKRTREVARDTAYVTHNHEEGMKGAEAVAAAIFLARNGEPKDAIKNYVVREFGYDLSRTLDEIRPGYNRNETCQKTVPEAITAFLEADGFEDTIRNAVSLGGDTDTLAAIAGSIAEAFYGVPAVLEAECRRRLHDDDMIRILDDFDRLTGRAVDTDPGNDPMQQSRAGNAALEYSIARMHRNPTPDTVCDALNVLITQMYVRNDHMLVPYNPETPFFDEEQLRTVKIGDKVTLDHDIHLTTANVQDENGRTWLPAFTSLDELEKGSGGSVRINRPITAIVQEALCRNDVAGLVINPFGQPFSIGREILPSLLKNA